MLGIGLGITSRLRSSVFNPASLFRNGEQGWFYDLYDMSTLFQDAAGTTPVTAVAQPVGLVLDKSKWLVLQTSLVSNGDFSGGATGWTLGTGWSVAGGVATKVAGTASGLDQNISLVAGRTYLLQSTITRTAGTIQAQFLGGTTVNGVIRNTSGTFTQYIVAVTGNVTLRFNASADFAGTIDNISVRELPGIHRSQSASLPRPTYARHPLGGIRNLLTFTEEFDNAAWDKSGSTVARVSGAEWELRENVTTSRKSIQAVGISLSGGRLSVEVKPNGRNFLAIGSTNGAGLWSVYLFNLSTGTAVAGYVAGGVPAPTSPSIEPTTGGFYRIAVTLTDANRVVFLLGNGGDPIFESYAGDGTSGVIIRRPQLELGSTATAYQRVRSVFDVTEAGVPDLYYLSYDGSDDFLSTAPFAWGTDKATVVAGVRKLSDASGMLVETSANSPTNAGSFYVVAGLDSGPIAISVNGYTSFSKGSSTPNQNFTAQILQNSPDTAVITAIHDIAGDLSRIRRNGVVGTDGTADKGTGNFGTYPVFFGARGGTSVFFRGNEYPSFGINRLLTANELAQLERWTAQKTGVTL